MSLSRLKLGEICKHPTTFTLVKLCQIYLYFFKNNYHNFNMVKTMSSILYLFFKKGYCHGFDTVKNVSNIFIFYK